MILALQGRGVVSPGQRFHDRAWGHSSSPGLSGSSWQQKKTQVSLRGERRQRLSDLSMWVLICTLWPCLSAGSRGVSSQGNRRSRPQSQTSGWSPQSHSAWRQWWATGRCGECWSPSPSLNSPASPANGKGRWEVGKMPDEKDFFLFFHYKLKHFWYLQVDLTKKTGENVTWYDDGLFKNDWLPNYPINKIFTRCSHSVFISKQYSASTNLPLNQPKQSYLLSTKL